MGKRNWKTFFVFNDYHYSLLVVVQRSQSSWKTPSRGRRKRLFRHWSCFRLLISKWLLLGLSYFVGLVNKFRNKIDMTALATFKSYGGLRHRLWRWPNFLTGNKLLVLRTKHEEKQERILLQLSKNTDNCHGGNELGGPCWTLKYSTNLSHNPFLLFLKLWLNA